MGSVWQKPGSDDFEMFSSPIGSNRKIQYFQSFFKVVRKNPAQDYLILIQMVSSDATSIHATANWTLEEAQEGKLATICDN